MPKSSVFPSRCGPSLEAAVIRLKGASERPGSYSQRPSQSAAFTVLTEIPTLLYFPFPRSDGWCYMSTHQEVCVGLCQASFLTFLPLTTMNKFKVKCYLWNCEKVFAVQQSLQYKIDSVCVWFAQWGYIYLSNNVFVSRSYHRLLTYSCGILSCVRLNKSLSICYTYYRIGHEKEDSKFEVCF